MARPGQFERKRQSNPPIFQTEIMIEWRNEKRTTGWEGSAAMESCGKWRRREFYEKHGVALGTLDFWRKRRRQERGTVAGNRQPKLDLDGRAKVASSRLVAVELAGLPERMSTQGAGCGLAGSLGEALEVTGLERTLIDLAVRPD